MFLMGKFLWFCFGLKAVGQGNSWTSCIRRGIALRVFPVMWFEQMVPLSSL